MKKEYSIKEYNALKTKVTNLRVSLVHAWTPEEHVRIYNELKPLKDELQEAVVCDYSGNQNIIPKYDELQVDINNIVEKTRSR